MIIICRRAILALFVTILVLALILGSFCNPGHKSYSFELLFSMAAVLAACWLIRKRQSAEPKTGEEKNPETIMWVQTALCLLVNGVWVLVFRPVQAADYQTFWQAAVDLSKGEHLQAADYLAMFPHILGYSSFLSVFLRIFGRSIMTAAFLNVVLTCITGILIFNLVRNWAGMKAAAFAYSLWIFCPSKLLYNTMVLSEPYYTCFLLLFFFLLAKAEQKEASWNMGQFVLLGAAGGLVLRLVNTARPIGMIAIIALVLWIFFLKGREAPKTKWMLLTAGVLLVYTLTGMIWNRYAAEELGQNPPSVPGYNIYVGWNLESGGSYSDEDMTWFQSRYFGEYERDAQKTQTAMLQSAKERIQSEKREIPQLLLRKLRTLLGNDEGGAFYSLDSLKGQQYALLCVVSNVWYYAVCILALNGCILMWRRTNGNAMMLLILFMLGLIMAQMLVEVASRYHYSLIPMLTALAAYARVQIKKPETEEIISLI